MLFFLEVQLPYHHMFSNGEFHLAPCGHKNFDVLHQWICFDHQPRLLTSTHDSMWLSMVLLSSIMDICAFLAGDIDSSIMSTSAEQAKKACTEFEAKVKRTVFLDNLSPQVTASVIKTALGQFGSVKNVEFIPNFTIPYNIPQSVLVEMENAKQAINVINEMSNYPFMMSGMPRPIRARAAKVEMFADRPALPDRKIQVRWVEPSNPDFEVAKKLKQLCRKHQAEHLALVKLQLEEEGKLAKQQGDMLKANYKKYEMIDSIMSDGTAARLARHYGIHLSDE